MINFNQAVINSNSSSIKSKRGPRHESYKTWDAYEHVRLEASREWGVQKHVGYKAREAGEHARLNKREINEHVTHVRHESM